MTKEELIQKLNEISTRKCVIMGIETVDKEYNHIDADNLLLEYINDTDVTKAFNNIKKWYA